MPKEKSETKNLNNNLKRLSEITKWFEDQEEIDVEEGLKKVKEAVGLIKASKERLKTVENEFEEIKKEVGIKEDNDGGEEEIDAKDIPF
jgi:exonuclease VII small subunit